MMWRSFDAIVKNEVSFRWGSKTNLFDINKSQRTLNTSHDDELVFCAFKSMFINDLVHRDHVLRTVNFGDYDPF